MSIIKVQNLSGKKEPFSSQKVYRSARNAGADKNLAVEITKKIEKKIYPNIKTSEIFKEVRRLLRERNFKASLKFDLKSAMRKLGPTGFPFEKYIKSVLENRGFKTRINLYIKGKCCTHEIDFLAKKGKFVYFGECKYRNLPDTSVGLNIALSNYARFLDLQQGIFLKKFPNCKIESILVTNAKFTSQAITYSKCVEVKMLGWKYPRKEGLEKIIENNKLYPITILPSLSVKTVDIFTLQGKVLANDVLSINLKNFAEINKINRQELEKGKREAEILLSD